MGWQLSARTIESRNHPLLKRIRACIRSGELLDNGPGGGSVLLETPRLIEDALASGIRISCLIVREPLGATAKKILPALPRSAELVRLPSATFESLSTTETGPGAMALAEAPEWTTSHLFGGGAGSGVHSAPPLLLVVAGVQDPGNLGAMLRAAEAFGFTGAILLRGTVSPWNAKAFRASAGSALRLPILRNFTAAQTVQLLNEHHVKLYGAEVRNGRAPGRVQAQGALAIAVGAEAAGLPPEIGRASEPLSIPISERVDSLNVAAAAAIIMYEFCKLRMMQQPAKKGRGIIR